MVHPKEILVVTTSSLEGFVIKEYLKPISSHIVTGTNLFSDFFASLTDVFGGRSQTYQKQLVSLYNEAIEQIKYTAYEAGANCVVGLKIDMDEISGKGKSMFMLTAVGTAVIAEKQLIGTMSTQTSKIENIGIEKINTLKIKKELIGNAENNTLMLNNETWSFITLNQVHEVFPSLLKKFESRFIEDQMTSELSINFYQMFLKYIDVLPHEKKLELVYSGIKSTQNEKIGYKLSEIIKELQLFDYSKAMEILKSDNFKVQKIGIQIATFDKPFYNGNDIKNLQNIKEYIEKVFTERGSRDTKKQLLSSKEKEIWICECSKSNDIDTYCGNCGQDIYGFKQNEMNPATAGIHLDQKIELITESIQ